MRKKLPLHAATKSEHLRILVNISKQKLYLIKGEKTIKKFPISTSKYGIGNKDGSYKTPLGKHVIAEKRGRGAKIGEIFESGKRTRKIATINKDINFLEDVVTTRLMKLKGLEPGINEGKGIDSYKRCIYIHGTAAEKFIGKPASHGCIRMKNKDVIILFDLVRKGTLVEIVS